MRTNQKSSREGVFALPLHADQPGTLGVRVAEGTSGRYARWFEGLLARRRHRPIAAARQQPSAGTAAPGEVHPQRIRLSPRLVNEGVIDRLRYIASGVERDPVLQCSAQLSLELGRQRVTDGPNSGDSEMASASSLTIRSMRCLDVLGLTSWVRQGSWCLLQLLHGIAPLHRCGNRELM